MRTARIGRAIFLFAVVLSHNGLASLEHQHLGADGQLVLEGIPEIPSSLEESLSGFHNTRSTLFAGWTANSKSIYIKTRYDGVNQLHRVDRINGGRTQLTSSDEPVREVARQPTGDLIAYTMDKGGSGFDQIMLLDPGSGVPKLLTDGHSLNNRIVWNRSGDHLAFRSTRRNGSSNDIWIMDVNRPQEARMVMASGDGALWKPVDFTADGKTILVQYYAGITDSRIYLLDTESGELRLLVGDPESATSNVASAFSADDRHVLFVTNQRGGSAEIGMIPVNGVEPVIYMKESIVWDVSEFRLSRDRSRGAFVTNEEGISRLYLFDPAEMEATRVRRIPLGVISHLSFSPNGQRLGMTLTTARNPNDAFVLKLGRPALKSGRIARWTRSSLGGMNERKLVDPELIHFPAPMLTSDRTILMPAFVYKPRGRGPHPVIIYIHGGPEGQFRPSFNSTIQMWIDKLDVAVIAPNVRGSLGYGEHYLAMDDGVLRENSVKDIGALIDWISRNREFDEDRIGVYGASYGGYMALASTVHFGDRIKAAVNRAGISNFVTYLENTQDYRRDLRRVEYGDERDPDMRAFLEQISPLNNVERIATPLLIVQGQNDPVVPVTESQQIVTALRERGRPVWYMNALNEGHVYEKKENKDIFQQVTFLFLQRFLID